MNPAQPGVAKALEQSLLGFDFGVRRVGVASGNTVAQAATPLTTVDAVGGARFDAIARLVKQWAPDALVVGIPRHPDGASHALTEQAERFARQLEGRFGLPVWRVDERYSSVEAARAAPQDLDAASAAVILQQWLDQPAHHHSTHAGAA